MVPCTANQWLNHFYSCTCSALGTELVEKETPELASVRRPLKGLARDFPTVGSDIQTVQAFSSQSSPYGNKVTRYKHVIG